MVAALRHEYKVFPCSIRIALHDDPIRQKLEARFGIFVIVGNDEISCRSSDQSIHDRIGMLKIGDIEGLPLAQQIVAAPTWMLIGMLDAAISPATFVAASDSGTTSFN